MNEISTNDIQLIGTSDATKNASEALPKVEVVLNAEQKQVVDVMQIAGKKLENAELGAREAAAGQLKQLHGKELVDAGLKQMGHGVWETVKSQAKWAIGGGLVGALGLSFITGPASLLAKQDDVFRDLFIGRLDDEQLSGIGMSRSGSGSLGKVLKSSMITGADLGGTLGEFIGFETAGLEYNKKVAAKNNLPPVKWFDWVISNVGLTTLDLAIGARNIGWVGRAGRYILNEAFNPVTVAGARAVGKGLWEMRKG